MEYDQSKYIKHYAVIEEPAPGNTPDLKQLFKNDFSENMLLHSYNWPKDAPPEAKGSAANKTRLKQQQIVIKFQTESRADSETERKPKLTHYK